MGGPHSCENRINRSVIPFAGLMTKNVRLLYPAPDQPDLNISLRPGQSSRAANRLNDHVARALQLVMGNFPRSGLPDGHQATPGENDSSDARHLSAAGRSQGSRPAP